MVRQETFEQRDDVPSYLGRLTQSPLLTPEEEITLTRAAQAGSTEARRRLIESNMRLVINIAKSYNCSSVPLEDLIQEGAIGLMHAVERYDPNKGFRLSTYATHWIRQAVGRAIDNKSKAIRLPTHVSQALRRIERARLKVMRELGREPTTDQVAAELGINGGRLAEMIRSSQDLLSLDMKVGDGESATLGSLLQDSNTEDPEAAALSGEFAEELEEVMSHLSDKERRVIQFRMKSSSGEDSEGRDTICEELAISRERMRQIEIQAIKKLRRLAQIHRLGDRIPS